MTANMIKILKIEIGQAPYIKEIGNDLKSMQDEVGGLIQPVYLGEKCLAVVNEEGKINGMQPNRWLSDNDIICGAFFICADDGEDFGSLNERQIELCQELFAEVPEFSGMETQLEPRAFVIGFDELGGM